MLRSYLRLMLFAVGLLVGVQVPGFIADYANRVEAHRIEAAKALEGFRATAGRFFQGDLQALVTHYRESQDPVMRSDAQSVATLVNRSALLEEEAQAMRKPWYARAWHVLAKADAELRAETLAAYDYQVPLVPGAIAWGIVCALLLAWSLESLLLLVGVLFGGSRRRRMQQRHWR